MASSSVYVIDEFPALVDPLSYGGGECARASDGEHVKVQPELQGWGGVTKRTKSSFFSQKKSHILGEKTNIYRVSYLANVVATGTYLNLKL